MSSTDFFLCHVFATNDVDSPVVSIMGENSYGNAGEARAGALIEINNLYTGSLLFEEFVPIASVIFKVKDSYTSGIKAKVVLTDEGNNYVDWRTTELKPGAGATDHNNLAGLEIAG